MLNISHLIVGGILALLALSALAQVYPPYQRHYEYRRYEWTDRHYPYQRHVMCYRYFWNGREWISGRVDCHHRYGPSEDRGMPDAD